jgi:hypothetical protein
MRAEGDGEMMLRCADLSGREARRTQLPDERIRTPKVDERFTGVAYALDRKADNKLR